LWRRRFCRTCLVRPRRIIDRLPAVYAALNVGHIDVAKANAFADALSLLEFEAARAILDRLIDRAGR
jgi:hypothetical protein